MAIPWDGDDDDISTRRAILVARALDSVTEFISRCLRASRVTRTEGDPVPGHCQASGKPPSLLTGSAEDADRMVGDIGKITGVCRLRARSGGHASESCHTVPVGRLRMDLTPLRQSRDYRFLFVSGVITYLGSMITYVALPFQVALHRV